MQINIFCPLDLPKRDAEVSCKSTIRSAFQLYGFNCTERGTFSLNGATLHDNEFDQTFEDLGYCESNQKCYIGYIPPAINVGGWK